MPQVQWGPRRRPHPTPRGSTERTRKIQSKVAEVSEVTYDGSDARHDADLFPGDLDDVADRLDHAASLANVSKVFTGPQRPVVFDQANRL